MQCGAPAPQPPSDCAGCGEPLPAAARFCSSCGLATGAATPESLPAPRADQPVAERRVTSVLFGDLVGFTPLSESKDSEEVRELLSAYFQQCRMVVARYGGVIEKFIGDAVMAVWGVPVAHEDDAERAVRAGLDLVAMVTRLGEEVDAEGLAQRVGVVTGEVAVTVGATAEGMVAGDAVNTAARVQAAASPGQVWVDETTHALASAAVSFTDAGAHELKGKAQPMRLWRAGAVAGQLGGAQRVDGLEAPFTGHDADLRVVKELFHGTQESGRPRLVVLDGEAGIGKSRLAWEFEKYVDGLATTSRWHRGRCLSYGDGVAFWALAEAFRARFGLVEADTGEVVTQRLDAGLATYVADAGERDWLRPRLAVLLGVGGGATFSREDLFAAWTAFLERLAQDDRSVVLVLDDAQHADDGLLDFLDHLMATARTPIFVLALARPDLLARRTELGGRRASIVRLEPLDDGTMASLVDGLVADLSPATRSALVRRAEGIPLFAVETVRALIDRDLVIPRDGRYVAASAALDLDAIGAPATLHALVAARLDALTAEEKRLVADAAVLGLTFTRDGLLALGTGSDAVDSALDSLRRREIFSIQTDRFSAERGQYRFVQSVVRQVAYGTLSKRDRKVRHVAAAEQLISESDQADDVAALIAQHLLDAVEAAPSTDADVPALLARAGQYLERAAKRAAAMGAPTEARHLLEVALSSAADPAEQARLHLGAAHASNTAGDYRGGRDHARLAATDYDQLGAVGEAARAVAAEANAVMALGEIAAAVHVAEIRWDALDGHGEADTDRARFELAGMLALGHQRLGDFDAVGRYAEQALLLAEGMSDPSALSVALNRVASRYQAIGAPVAAIMLWDRAAHLARENDLLEPLAILLVNLASSQTSRHLPAALDYARDGMVAARRCGSQHHIDYARLNHLIALWLTGDLSATAAALSDALDGATDPEIRLSLRTIEAWLAAAQGQPVPERTEDHNPLTDNEVDKAWQDSADITRAMAAHDAVLAAGIAADSLSHLVTAAGIDDDFCSLWPPLVQAALAAGDVDLADRLLHPVESARPGLVSPGVAAQWHRLRGLVSAARGDDPEFAEAELRIGIAALEAFGAVGFAAQAQEELARWLVDQVRPGDARPLVEAARAVYTAIGAHGWLGGLDGWAGAEPPAIRAAVIG
jgi:class 3 adenylate cyclase/predicted ATPase